MVNFGVPTRKVRGRKELSLVSILLVALPLSCGMSLKAFAGPQAAHNEPGPPAGQGSHEMAATPTPLSALVDEARKNDPAILGADRAAKAATFVAPQMSSLPDPQLVFQQLDVGSPRPFAGYTNSDFAYVGIGVSQQLPYPGKLKLRGEVADADADTAKAHTGVVSADEIDALKATYFKLAYLQQTLGILERDAALLKQMEQQAEAHYSSRQGNQQEVLKAQLERTKILREISMHHQLMGEAQAELKRVLRRPQDSPDIIAQPLAATFL